MRLLVKPWLYLTEEHIQNTFKDIDVVLTTLLTKPLDYIYKIKIEGTEYHLTEPMRRKVVKNASNIKLMMLSKNYVKLL